MNTRRDLIERALAKVSTPVSVTTKPGVGLIRARLEQLGDEPLKPGEATNLLRNASQDEHVLLSTLYAKQQIANDYGKYAPDPMADVLGRMNAHPTLGKLLDGLETDAITKELIERRGGSDSERPLDPTSRADVISAALDMHSTGDE